MTDTFRSAYAVLQQHAQTLRNQREPDIDDLLEIVTQSVAAYKVCQARITAVEQALEEALGGAAVDAASGHAPGSDPQAGDPGSTGPDEADLEDDIPF